MAKQKRQITKEEYENAIKVRRKISSTINITITVISLVAAILSALAAVAGVISYDLMSVIMPGAMALYLVMGVLSIKEESRKSVMIIYIVAISICVIVFFFDLIYFNLYK